MKKVFAIILILVILAGFGLVLLKKNEEASQAEEYLLGINTEVRMIRDQIKQLQREKAELSAKIKDAEASSAEGASITLLFTDMSEAIYSVARPAMSNSEYQYRGMLAISNNYFPGRGSSMSLDKYIELVNAGWETCILWDEKDPNIWGGIADFSGWFYDLASQFAS